MKIGVIYLSYNNDEYLEQFLSPWIHAKEQKLDGHEFVISAVSLPFAEYKNVQGFEEDNVTYKKLETLLMYEKIDFLTTTPKYVSEAEARTLGVNPLLLQDFKQNKDKSITMIEPCDVIFLVDGDENFTKKTIGQALEFIELNKHTSWFSFNFRNYVFDNKHYLEDYFVPPRIFRTRTNGFSLKEFYFDNDVTYREELSGKEVSYKNLPSMNFPKNIFAKHYTWLNNDVSRKKIEYQTLHFKNGPGCSYKWNEATQSVEFNEEYYKKIGQSLPTVLKE